MSVPRISALRARGVRLPLSTPVQTAAGVLHETPLALLDVASDDGLWGHAYLRTYTPRALAALLALLEALAELVVGLAAEPGPVRARLGAEFRLLGQRGLVGAAGAGLDAALWDLCAQRAGLPLARLLGAERTRIPAYAALASMSPREAAAQAEHAAQRGFRAVKVKLGGGALERDLETARAVRSAVGPDLGLMADYNQSLTPFEAIRRIRALAELRLAWIEEPVAGGDLPGHAEVRSAVQTPIQSGENWESLDELRTALRLGAGDLVMLDAMRIGGPSGWREAAALAEQASLPLSSHAFPELSVHLLAASPTAHWLEYSGQLDPLLEEPLAVRAGWAELPSRPGAGLNWRPAAVSRYQSA